MKAHESHLPTFFLPKRKAVKKHKGLNRGPLRKVSKRRAVELREYTELRADFIVLNPYCIPCWDRNVVTLTKEIHHRNKRVGKKLNDTSDWLPCCVKCHREIHAHPSTSRQLGYLV